MNKNFTSLSPSFWKLWDFFSALSLSTLARQFSPLTNSFFTLTHLFFYPDTFLLLPCLFNKVLFLSIFRVHAQINTYPDTSFPFK